MCMYTSYIFETFLKLFNKTGSGAVAVGRYKHVMHEKAKI